VIDKQTNRRLTRWQEAIQRMEALIEIIAYVPIQKIRIKFLNEGRVIERVREGSAIGETPAVFIEYMRNQLSLAKGPSGSTPALKALRMSFNEPGTKSIYFFGKKT
jgi:hypothetical protein